MQRVEAGGGMEAAGPKSAMLGRSAFAFMLQPTAFSRNYGADSSPRLFAGLCADGSRGLFAGHKVRDGLVVIAFGVRPRLASSVSGRYIVSW